MLPIQVGVCTCDNRVIDKTRFISSMITYNCEVYRECTVVNPVFILEYNATILTSNYLFVPSWGRYYHIKDVELTPAGRMFVSCLEDVLMSNKDAILNLDCNIVRNENKRNKLLYDGKYPEEIMDTICTLKFNASPFGVDNGYNIVMCVIGGEYANQN